MYSVNLKKKTEQSDSILRDSAVRYSIFCGSLFSPVAGRRRVSLIEDETSLEPNPDKPASGS
jgi:hypothetical protein